MKFTFDTNVLVDALRQPAELERLKSFLSWALPHTVLSSIVAAELLSGARTQTAQEMLESELLFPFERRGRVLAPSVAAWQRMGTLMARSVVTAVSASQQNDALLAVQARELGWRLITRDRDFARLSLLIPGLQVIPPFPVPI